MNLLKSRGVETRDVDKPNKGSASERKADTGKKPTKKGRKNKEQI